ncbi:hypothetical protein, partial [Stutzerimonas kunmingensis]|uniref:hypothetical protein n=1 Tax=Stutzerimonas kunmingensis TaxID=1211807 RepID=UPI0028AE2D8D
HQHGEQAKPDAHCRIPFACHRRVLRDMTLWIGGMIAQPFRPGRCDMRPQQSRAINLLFLPANQHKSPTRSEYSNKPSIFYHDLQDTTMKQ